jgi:cytochrome P450
MNTKVKYTLLKDEPIGGVPFKKGDTVELTNRQAQHLTHVLKPAATKKSAGSK